MTEYRTEKNICQAEEQGLTQTKNPGFTETWVRKNHAHRHITTSTEAPGLQQLDDT